MLRSHCGGFLAFQGAKRGDSLLRMGHSAARANRVFSRRRLGELPQAFRNGRDVFELYFEDHGLSARKLMIGRSGFMFMQDGIRWSLLMFLALGLRVFKLFISCTSTL